MGVGVRAEAAGLALGVDVRRLRRAGWVQRRGRGMRGVQRRPACGNLLLVLVLVLLVLLVLLLVVSPLVRALLPLPLSPSPPLLVEGALCDVGVVGLVS